MYNKLEIRNVHKIIIIAFKECKICNHKSEHI